MAKWLWAPSFGSESETEPRVGVVKFGDGYEQRMADGINTVLPTWNLEWSEAERSVVRDMVAFLKARGGLEAFEFKDPDGEWVWVVCRRWRNRYVKPDVNTLQAAFEQVPAP
ncbi:MAG: phage tail protein [Methylotetracoccus sp.]